MTHAARELDVAHITSNIDIIFLTEVELPASDSFSVPGFITLYPRSTPLGMYRLLALVDETLAAQTNVSLIYSSHVDMWLRFQLGSSGTLAIGGVYRQWSSDEVGDLALIHEHATLITSSYKRCILMGDFNLDSARLSDESYSRKKLASQHMKAMDAAGLSYAGPSTPTYFSHGEYNGPGETKAKRRSIIDHVYSAGIASPQVAVGSYAATDHRPVTVTVPKSISHAPVVTLTRRNLKKVSSTAFCAAINVYKLAEVFQLDDVDTVHDIIIGELVKAMDKVAPRRQIHTKRRPTPLYLAPDTRAVMAARDRAAVSGSSDYRTLRNRANHLVRRDKHKSAENFIASTTSSGSATKLWRLANTVLGRSSPPLPSSMVTSDGMTVSGDNTLAVTMNDFFIDKVTKIRSGITQTAPKSKEEQVCLNLKERQFTLSPPSPGMVAKIISSLNNTGAIGADGVPVLALKLAAPVICAPVAHMAALSFKFSKVPAAFKRAIVVPVFKGKGKASGSPSSYRPVAILSAFSKVLEKIVLKSLTPYLASRLPACQYGFRPRRNTTAAVATAHGAWAKAVTAGRIVAIAAFDLSAAFDTLDPNTLINKLSALGIAGTEADWFRSYLNGRTQCVRYNGSTSSYKPVAYGVPQGSLLGPVLFLTMIADLPDAMDLDPIPSHTGGTIGYADDVLMWIEGTTVASVKAVMEDKAKAVTKFMADHFLALNPDKTQIVWAGSGTITPSVSIGETVVTPSNTIEILGLKFNRNLKTNPHLEAVTASAASLSGIARRLRAHLPVHHAAEVTKALMVGKVGYGAAAAIFPRLSSEDPQSGNMAKLQARINDAARVIRGVSLVDACPTSELLNTTGLPSANRLAIKSTAIEAWKALGPGATSNDDPLITLFGPTVCSNTRASTAGLLGPATRLPFDTFVNAATMIWNKYPLLRTAPTLTAAKKIATDIALAAPI